MREADHRPAPPMPTVAPAREPEMGLRDYFAAHALAGLIGAHKSMFYNPQEAAKASYEAADAMMIERERPK